MLILRYENLPHCIDNDVPNGYVQHSLETLISLSYMLYYTRVRSFPPHFQLYIVEELDRLPGMKGTYTCLANE